MFFCVLCGIIRLDSNSKTDKEARLSSYFIVGFVSLFLIWVPEFPECQNRQKCSCRCKTEFPSQSRNVFCKISTSHWTLWAWGGSDRGLPPFTDCLSLSAPVIFRFILPINTVESWQLERLLTTLRSFPCSAAFSLQNTLSSFATHWSKKEYIPVSIQRVQLMLYSVPVKNAPIL